MLARIAILMGFCVLFCCWGCASRAPGPQGNRAEAEGHSEGIDSKLLVPREKASGRLPILAEYMDHASSNLEDPVRGPRLVMAVFADGHCLFSTDGRLGGAPFLASQLHASQVATLKADMRQAIAVSPVAKSHVGPDMSSIVIVANLGPDGPTLGLESSHEMYNEPEASASPQPGTASSARRLDDPQRTWSESYRMLRAQWLLLRLIQRGCRPDDLQPVSGDPIEFVPYEDAMRGLRVRGGYDPTLGLGAQATPPRPAAGPR